MPVASVVTVEATPARPDPWQVRWYPTPAQDFVQFAARSAALGVTLLRALTAALRAYGVPETDSTDSGGSARG